ncbi:MAG: adenylate/guanylate cyclase domain-containing protein [Leptolyngbyaceae cyanobacterium bins.302]|nr:adenylate/guanylate cyclase domain-containing protein [Leptolyngbyaceae cyanobacterium bins.302]
MASGQESGLKQLWLKSIQGRVGLVIGAPILAQLLGSLFNIWYNFTYVQPLLSAAQLAVFWKTVAIYNPIAYLAGFTLWLWVTLSLINPCQRVMAQQAIAPQTLLKAQQRVINLPWWGMAIAGGLWLFCIPVFLVALMLAPGTLHSSLYWDLPISFIIAALIALTHSFFTIELLTQRLLYPILFQNVRPFRTPGAFPLSLRLRGLFHAFSGSICPIVSLLVLTIAPHTCEMKDVGFATAVGAIGIAFSLTSAWMVGQLVIEPIKELKHVATAVAEGNLKVRIATLRADEFGPLIDEINHMIGELKEKQILQETFGRHVGEQAAIQILQRDPRLGGIEQELTVMFADLRNFTRRCSEEPPERIVMLLNLFLTEMVDIVEQQHGGMVNKFLGDGFMALFGVGEAVGNHAGQAVAAARSMLDSLQKINHQLELEGLAPLSMGIGIHTGNAVVGSIGSSRRLEYTAIGHTVNIASRVESLTKEVGERLLITAATQQKIAATIATEALPPRYVKGQDQPLNIFRLASS